MTERQEKYEVQGIKYEVLSARYQVRSPQNKAHFYILYKPYIRYILLHNLCSAKLFAIHHYRSRLKARAAFSIVSLLNRSFVLATIIR